MTSDYLLALIAGVSVGSVYGLAAMGLVLTYKTSGLFNFGQGAVAAVGAFVFYACCAPSENDWPWPVGVAISVLIFGPLAGLALELISRGLSRASLTSKVVATIGVLLIFRQIGVIIYGEASRPLDVFLPNSSFTVGSTFVGLDQVITVLIGLTIAVMLTLFFKLSRTGKAMRAVVDDPELLDLTGVNPVRVRRVAWMVGTSFAALSGVLIAPQQNAVDGSLLTLLIVQAFGAAVFGAFRSVPLAYVGGLAVGVLQALVQKWTSGSLELQQLGPNVPFLVLFFGLLVIPRRKLVAVGRETKSRAAPSAGRATPKSMTGVAIVLGFFLAVPMFAGTKLVYWSGSISTFVLLMSLGLLVRTSGQISLCHVGLAAVGAAAFSRLAAEHHVPWLLAILVAGLVTTVVGLIIAVPAVRLSGLYLALATFGFGILLAQMFYTREFFFGQSDGIPMPRPDFWRFSSDRGYYYAELFVACGCALLVVVIERSRLGRLLRGLADSPIALTTLGANANVTRIIAFSVSAFLAGVSGALLGAQFQTIDQNSFVVFSSLILVAVLAISGRSTVRAAVIGSLLFTVMPGYVNDPEFNQWLPLIFGSAALVAAVGSQGWNLPERFARAAAGNNWRIAGPTRPVVVKPPRARSAPSARPADDHGTRRRDRVGSSR